MNLRRRIDQPPAWSARPTRGLGHGPLWRAVATAAIGLAVIIACLVIPDVIPAGAVLLTAILGLPIATGVGHWWRSIPGVLSWPILAAGAAMLTHPHGVDVDIWEAVQHWSALDLAFIAAFFALPFTLFGVVGALAGQLGEWR